MDGCNCSKGLATAALLLCCVVAAHAADWPHWRGPARGGTTAELSGWEAGAWPLGAAVWTALVGEGASSPLVVEGRLYTMGWNDGVDRVICLEAATGHELWRQTYPAPRHGRHANMNLGIWGGPCSTPEYDQASGYLYTLGTDGALICWDTRNGGRRVWGLNLYDRYGAPQRPNVGGHAEDYGYTTAPLVHGEMLIVEVGAPEGALMAFDKATGERLWVSECADPAGHGGGLAPLKVEGVPCVAVLTLRRLVIVRLEEGHEGETLATYDWQTDYGQNIATPAVHEDTIIVTSGYNVSRMARFRAKLDGITKLWETRIFSKVCSPVIHKGRIYIAWGTARCVDLETGASLWSGGNFGDDGSCLVTGDDRLVLCGNGRLALAETAQRSPAAYTELASRSISGVAELWPHVTLAESRLYVKDRKGLLQCFALGG